MQRDTSKRGFDSDPCVKFNIGVGIGLSHRFRYQYNRINPCKIKEYSPLLATIFHYFLLQSLTVEALSDWNKFIVHYGTEGIPDELIASPIFRNKTDLNS